MLERQLDGFNDFGVFANIFGDVVFDVNGVSCTNMFLDRLDFESSGIVDLRDKDEVASIDELDFLETITIGAVIDCDETQHFFTAELKINGTFGDFDTPTLTLDESFNCTDLNDFKMFNENDLAKQLNDDQEIIFCSVFSGFIQGLLAEVNDVLVVKVNLDNLSENFAKNVEIPEGLEVLTVDLVQNITLSLFSTALDAPIIEPLFSYIEGLLGRLGIEFDFSDLFEDFISEGEVPELPVDTSGEFDIDLDEIFGEDTTGEDILELLRLDELKSAVVQVAANFGITQDVLDLDTILTTLFDFLELVLTTPPEDDDNESPLKRAVKQLPPTTEPGLNIMVLLEILFADNEQLLAQITTFADKVNNVTLGDVFELGDTAVGKIPIFALFSNDVAVAVSLGDIVELVTFFNAQLGALLADIIAEVELPFEVNSFSDLLNVLDFGYSALSDVFVNLEFSDEEGFSDEMKNVFKVIALFDKLIEQALPAILADQVTPSQLLAQIFGTMQVPLEDGFTAVISVNALFTENFVVDIFSPSLEVGDQGEAFIETEIEVFFDSVVLNLQIAVFNSEGNEEDSFAVPLFFFNNGWEMEFALAFLVDSAVLLDQGFLGFENINDLNGIVTGLAECAASTSKAFFLSSTEEIKVGLDFINVPAPVLPVKLRKQLIGDAFFELLDFGFLPYEQLLPGIISTALGGAIEVKVEGLDSSICKETSSDEIIAARNQEEDDSGVDGALIGGVVAGIVVLALILVVLVLFLKSGSAAAPPAAEAGKNAEGMEKTNV